MTLWAKFKDFVEGVAGDESRAHDLREEELRLAAGGLMVAAGTIDGTFTGEELRPLLTEAVLREHESVDLYRFTSVLCRELDQDGRKRIVEMLWEVAMADGVVHEFESNLVWRTAELLGVSTRDRVMLRKAVEARIVQS